MVKVPESRSAILANSEGATACYIDINAVRDGAFAEDAMDTEPVSFTVNLARERADECERRS